MWEGSSDLQQRTHFVAGYSENDVKRRSRVFDINIMGYSVKFLPHLPRLGPPHLTDIVLPRYLWRIVAEGS